MSVKTILVPLGGDDRDKQVLETALIVARRFDGHIVALHVMQRPQDAAPFMFEQLSKKIRDTVLQEAENDARESAEEVRAAFESFCAGNDVATDASAGGVTAGWIEEFGEVSDCIVRHGRVADAITIARPELTTGDVRRTPAGRNLQAVLLGAGRPVVIVPPDWQAKRIEHAAIGWNESLEASRALAMTIPWLTQMETVSVIVSEKRQAGVPALLEYLGRHGVEAQVQILSPGRGPVGQAILESCRSVGAEFLVVGGFSHSRSRQLLFGGVTRHLLNHSEIVTVMVH